MANIIGTPNKDFLIGTADPDLIFALAGNDTIFGNKGNDIIRAGKDNDRVFGGQDNDELYGDNGNDTLFGDLGSDTLYGVDGNDSLNGNKGNDFLYGNRGNDTLRGGMDNDLIHGGQDNDELYGDMGNDTLFGDLGTDTLYGVDGNDSINGNKGNDFLYGNTGNDTIRGGKADDFIRGGRDNDQLYGDLGNDSVYGDLDNDTLVGSDGTDLLSGNQGNDSLNGNIGNDTVYGGQGNDTVRGGKDNDSLFGDKGNDAVYGDLGNDTLFGGPDTDLMFGDQGPEANFGGNGNDFLFGNEGDDTLFGLGGNDFLSGNQGDDSISGNMGLDTIFGGLGNDTIRGGMQNDLLFGDKGSDVLFGDLGADTLTGDIKGEVFTDIFVVGRVTGAATKTTGGPNRPDADLITDFQPCIDFISLTGGLSYDNLNIFQGTGTDAANTIIQDKGTGEFLAVLGGVNRDSIDGTSFIPAGPPDVRIRATDPAAAEPTLGSPLDIGEFEIFTPCPVETTLLVRYTISGNATNGTDYNPINGVVPIFAGSNRATIPIIPLADNLIEGNETVTLTLLDLPAYNVVVPNNTATVTIAEGPAVPPAATKPTVIISAIDPTASEPGRNPSEGNGVFQISRTGGDPNVGLTVRLTFTGTATPDDYGLSTTTVTFAPGDVAPKTITVTPTATGGIESTETVVATIANDLNYVVGAADTATVRIFDADILPTPPPAQPAPNTANVVYVDNSGATPGAFPTITAGINAVQAGGTVVILRGTGTYTENPISINKSVTLRGPNAGISPASGSSVAPAVVTTTAAGLGNPVFTIAAGVSNVTIEGLTIQMRGDNGIRQQTGVTNLTIRQNEFIGDGPPNGGVIYLDYEGNGSGANVIDNLIRDVTTTGGSVTSGVQLFRIGGVRATDNQIANLTGPGIVADALIGATNIINNNRVDNIRQQGIQLAGGNATIANNNVTNANTASGADDGGIRLRDSGLTAATLGTVDVFSNTITNSFNGIAIRPGTTVPNSVRINFNNLILNSNAGLLHAGTGALNAENNWWDNVAGPVVNGTGPNAIRGASANQVDFDPFSQTPL